MNFISSPPQASFFYAGRWTEESVNVFIRILMDNIKPGKWDKTGDNVDAIQNALDFVNIMLVKVYSWDEAQLLYALLKKRFTTFKAVLATKDVRWDRTTNHVYADPHVWDSLFKADEFTKAFFHKGDEMYGCLRLLFGTELDSSTEVINISEDGPPPCAPNNAAAPLIVYDSEDEPEVESPVAGKRKPPCKKLFIEGRSEAPLVLVSAESNSKDLFIEPNTRRNRKSLFEGKKPRAMPMSFGGGSDTVNNVV